MLLSDWRRGVGGTGWLSGPNIGIRGGRMVCLCTCICVWAAVSGGLLDERAGIIYCLLLAGLSLVGVIYKPALLVVPFKR